MTGGEVAAAPAVFGRLRHLGLASYWFGLNFHWIPILTVLIPLQVSRLVQPDRQGSRLALITGLGAIFAVLLPPLVGAGSDRLSTRWGRRRPIMAVGTLGNLVGLLLLLRADSYGWLIAGYLVVQIFNNSAGAAFNGIIPDVVPEPEYGRASGLLGAFVQVGSVAGLAGTILMAGLGHAEWTYGLIAVVLLISLLPTLWASGGEGLQPVVAPPVTGGPAALARFLAPLFAGDFAWVILTRTFITAGFYAVVPFLLLFFRDVVRVRDPVTFTSIWDLLVLLAATPFGLAGGLISDRLGRKVFVYASGGLMSLVVVLFVIFFPTATSVVLGLGVLFGVGYGLYYAVDWALACDTLPDRRQPAKDMGLFHVSYTLPQVFMPAVAGSLLDVFNRQGHNAGYRAMFSASAACFLLGTVFVRRIRSVR